MKKIVGVRFKKPGKIYFFDPENFDIKMIKSHISIKILCLYSIEWSKSVKEYCV